MIKALTIITIIKKAFQRHGIANHQIASAVPIFTLASLLSAIWQKRAVTEPAVIFDLDEARYGSHT